jgi:phosphohistidine swiveling domain-containing protein
MSIQSQAQENSDIQTGAIVLPFNAIERASLALVGGKAANLGEMARAGLPVPPGFCITTTAYLLVAAGADLEPVLAAIVVTSASDTARLARLAADARARLLAAPVPDTVAEAIIEAYKALGKGADIPVAVRSSATAEDLPFASFAGQQDTYLNIVGLEALLDAVRRCWASLWTERAVAYRASNNIDPHSVSLAVAVQRMVDAAVAGVLFTANPVTGKRRQAVIDASPGLGEAVVSGAVNPDHFVINTPTGEIVERRLGDKRVIIRASAGGGTQRIEQAEGSDEACLSDEQLRALAQLGARVEAHYGAPQDTEWAIDADGRIWLTQARPITTLFPLPDTAPQTDDVLRVFFSLNVFQGVYRPFTPMGISAFRLFGSSLSKLLGYPTRDPLQGPAALAIAASRLFIDVTSLLRHPLGRAAIIGVVARFGEARSAAPLEQAVTDPRLSLISRSRRPPLRLVFQLLIKKRFLPYIIQALVRPATARKRLERWEANFRATEKIPASAEECLNAYEDLLLNSTGSLFPNLGPILIGGLGCYSLANRLLKDLATPDELQMVLRGLPYNPTTEMDLALWALAQQVRADAVATQHVRETAPEQLAQEYRAGNLPPALQQGLASFLRTYGHRAVAEIDLGLPRWSEDPAHLLGALANYLELTNPALAPDVQFQRSAQEAEAMVAELIRRATRKSRRLGLLVKFCLKRTRALVGLREKPKYCIVLVLARARQLLWPVGETLAQAGRLEAAEDIFFLTPQEARAALNGTDMRQTVCKRHADYEQELKRRHIPRVLLSDGTEPAAQTQSTTTTGEILQGTPASPGSVTALARVILNPTGAKLAPGEILVAPSTDPGWTPLFLTAGGLVMEMGGSISHGAVVAREYGIPAVVGVPEATERITTGQRITVDGSAGTVSIEEE